MRVEGLGLSMSQVITSSIIPTPHSHQDLSNFPLEAKPSQRAGARALRSQIEAIDLCSCVMLPC